MDSAEAITTNKQPAVNFDRGGRQKLTSEGDMCYGAAAISGFNLHKVFRNEKLVQHQDLQSHPVEVFLVVSGCASTIESVQT